MKKMAALRKKIRHANKEIVKMLSYRLESIIKNLAWTKWSHRWILSIMMFWLRMQAREFNLNLIKLKTKLMTEISRNCLKRIKMWQLIPTTSHHSKETLKFHKSAIPRFSMMRAIRYRGRKVCKGRHTELKITTRHWKMAQI